MAAALLKISASVAAGIGCVWYMTNGSGSDRSVHALSYGRKVFEREKKVKWDKDWDRRSPESLSKNDDSSKNQESGKAAVKPTAKRHLILIRHGQYVYAEKSEDKVLTEMGRRQADATGKRLKALKIPFTTIHYSTVVRATETAQIICEAFPDIPTKSTDLLREGAPIRPEPPSRHWKPEKWEFYEDGPRIEAAFRHFFHRAGPDQTEDTTEVIVCHGNVIRYFVCRALQLPPEAWLRMSIGHCGITRFTIRPNGMVSLQTLGDTGHLPPEWITYS